ncbi:MAG: Por secretion system C-terminal sorting domain-containing protein [Promethearchaeota archaeon]|nr:MAG: Por secretion system C-terminal sorting domain-containing protein [Candidatus Lokiarchaeota archaeon]
MQAHAQICSDGSGGAIITWDDDRNIVGKYDIYAQKINANGVIQWTPSNGVIICNATDEQIYPQICSNGFGGAIITWEDHRNAPDPGIYIQEINSIGVIQATTLGIALCTAENRQINPQICCDETGGAIIVWQDEREGEDSDDLYA